MVKIQIKGHEFEAVAIKDSFSRRAMKFKNDIITCLRSLGLTVDDIDLKLEQNAMKKAPASVSWYFDKQHFQYSHSSRGKYVENLYVVSKVIEHEMNDLFEDRITFEDFLNEFSEDIDIADKRKEARDVLGLDPQVNDLKVIDKVYKDLAKKHHPDTEYGNMERFKEINHAHKILKRELL